MGTTVLVFAAQFVVVVLLIAVMRFGKPPEGGPKLPEQRFPPALPPKKSRRGER